MPGQTWFSYILIEVEKKVIYKMKSTRSNKPEVDQDVSLQDYELEEEENKTAAEE